MKKHIIHLLLFSSLILSFCNENIRAQKPVTLSTSLIYDFNYFNTSRNVDEYYSNSFNQNRKTIFSSRPSGAYGLELSYGLSKKWMGVGGLIIAHYNYGVDKRSFVGLNEVYGYRLFSIPLSFKYFPMKNQEYFYVMAGVQIDNIVDVYGINIRNPTNIFVPQIYFFNSFQPGYVFAIACENHSSNKTLFGFGVHFKSKFTEVSDQFNYIDQAGEVLSAFGLEARIGYRFHNSRGLIKGN